MHLEHSLSAALAELSPREGNAFPSFLRCDDRVGLRLGRDSSRQEFYRKRIAKHVRMTSLPCSVGIVDISQSEQFPKAALIALNGTARITITAPEEITLIV